jgi:hypothetical protein
MLMPGRLPMSYHHMGIQGNAVVTKAMPVPPMIEVPDVTRPTGNSYALEAEAVFFVKQ